MRRLFSTEREHPANRFRHWREVCEDRLVPMEQSQLGDEPFHASIAAENIGVLEFSQFDLANLQATTTSRTIRHKDNKTDNLFISLVLSGTVRSQQNGLTAVDSDGDFTVRDTNTPWAIEHRGSTDVLAIGVPRNRLEAVLGSARHYAGLTIGRQLPTATLARSFLTSLLQAGDQLTPSAAARMSSVGIDLIVASIAERMQMETPKSLRGTIILQRAKAHIEASLGDPTLDPRQVAAAVGVSLRHLQQTFHAHGWHVSDWIWHRRLEAAARRLADPGMVHLQLGAVCYASGFVNQAHFSRRFKDRYGCSPGDYRRQAMGQKG